MPLQTNEGRRQNPGNPLSRTNTKKKGRAEIMCKVFIAGSACVVVSSLTPEDVDLFRLYWPEALDNNYTLDESYFFLEIDDGPGSLSKAKAVLSRCKSAEGKATITLLMDPAVEDKRQWIEKNLGAALAQLDGLEEELLKQIGKVREKQARVEAMITPL